MQLAATVYVLLHLTVLASPTALAAADTITAAEPRAIGDLLQAVNQVQCNRQLAPVSIVHVTARRHVIAHCAGLGETRT